MNRKSLVALVAGVILVLVLVVVGCGSKSSPTPKASPSPSPTSLEGIIEVTSVDVEPFKIKEGETTTITVEAHNYGGSQDTHSITLAINGIDVETKDITLAGGAHGSVAFSVTENTPGTYVISVGVITSILTVEEEAPPVTPGPDDGEEEEF